jgi:hypothetical protein
MSVFAGTSFTFAGPLEEKTYARYKETAQALKDIGRWPSGILSEADWNKTSAVWANLPAPPPYTGIRTDVMRGLTADKTVASLGVWQDAIAKALVNQDLLLRTPNGAGVHAFTSQAAAQAACTRQIADATANGWQMADASAGVSGGVCMGVAKLDQGGFGLLFSPTAVGAAGGVDPTAYSVWPKTCNPLNPAAECKFPTEYRGFQPLQGGQSACSLVGPNATLPFADRQHIQELSQEERMTRLAFVSGLMQIPQYDVNQGPFAKAGTNWVPAADFATAQRACLLDDTCAGVCRQPNPPGTLISGYGTYAKPKPAYTVGAGTSSVLVYNTENKTSWPDTNGRQWDAVPVLGMQPGTRALLGTPSASLVGVQVACASDPLCAGVVQYPDGRYQAVKSLVPGAFGLRAWGISAASASLSDQTPVPPYEPKKIVAPGSRADPRPAAWAAALPAPAGIDAVAYAEFMKDLCATLMSVKVRFLIYFNSQQKDDSTRVVIFGNPAKTGCVRETSSRIALTFDVVKFGLAWLRDGKPLPFPDPLPLNQAPGTLIYNMITNPNNVPAGSEPPESWMTLPTDTPCPNTVALLQKQTH